MNTTGKLIAFSLVTLLASCSGGNKWHLDGKISGLGEDDIVVLEGNNQGYWYPMDTLKCHLMDHIPIAVKHRAIRTSIV